MAPNPRQTPALKSWTVSLQYYYLLRILPSGSILLFILVVNVVNFSLPTLSAVASIDTFFYRYFTTILRLESD